MQMASWSEVGVAKGEKANIVLVVDEQGSHELARVSVFLR